jgi:MFS-type transporter involved in bile tolerance (Atg22 family)
MDEVEVYLHALLISTQVGGLWSASRSSCITEKDGSPVAMIFFFNSGT